jgi:hypothetical protein
MDRRPIYEMDSPARKAPTLREDVALLSSSREYDSDVHNGLTGGLRFSQPPPSKRDVTILILANPRSGSRMAGRWVTDFPKETSKLLVQGDNCMTSCRLVIFDVTD